MDSAPSSAINRLCEVSRLLSLSLRSPLVNEARSYSFLPLTLSTVLELKGSFNILSLTFLINYEQSIHSDLSLF